MEHKRLREILGISALVSALVLCVTFIVQAIRQRSVVKAFLAIAAAEGAVGASVLLAKEHVKINTKAADEVDEVDDEELFDEEESEEAELRVRSVLGGKRDGETAGAPSARREIPRDEDATEEDFL